MPNINLLCVAYNTSITIMVRCTIEWQRFGGSSVRIGQAEDTLEE